MDKTIVQQFEEIVGRFPNKVAIVSNNISYSYFQLNNYSNYLANQLLDKGIKPSSIIGIYGKKSVEMVAAILACLKVQCAYMPLDTVLSQQNIQLLLKKSDVSLLFITGVKSQFFDIETVFLDYTEFQSTIAYPNCSLPIKIDDAAYIMNTSGSTGVPKSVIVPHRGVIRLLINTNYIQIDCSDKVLFHSNTSFDAGIFEVWAALLNGATLYIADCLTGDLPTIFRICLEQKITILLLTTGLFHIFSTMDLAALSSLKYLVVGGDVMHSSAARRAISSNKNIKIINGYGPAENCVFTTCLTIDNEKEIENPVSIGVPITGTQVYLLDENFEEVPAGEIGELFTSGLGVALGYLGNPDLTNEKFIYLPNIAGNNLLYRTGDRVKKLSSGHFEFVGRSDNQVKIRGFRVELTEIETAISNFKFVEDVFVYIGEEKNKKIIAFVKINNTQLSQQEKYKKEIIDFFMQNLPFYYMPNRIEMSDTFPLTSNGKLDRTALKRINILA